MIFKTSFESEVPFGFFIPTTGKKTQRPNYSEFFPYIRLSPDLKSQLYFRVGFRSGLGFGVPNENTSLCQRVNCNSKSLLIPLIFLCGNYLASSRLIWDITRRKSAIIHVDLSRLKTRLESAKANTLISSEFSKCAKFSIRFPKMSQISRLPNSTNSGNKIG